jgi:hypothetical protein
MKETAARTLVQFGGWLAIAQPGDRALYHTGFLARDRQDSDRLDEFADHVALLSDSGMVSLIRRRVGEERWDYLAERTRRGRPDNRWHVGGAPAFVR